LDFASERAADADETGFVEPRLIVSTMAPGDG
jgi:hypothetical protein